MSTGTVILEIAIWTLIWVLFAWMLFECFRSIVYTTPKRKNVETIIIEPQPYQNVMVKSSHPVTVTSGTNGQQMIWNQSPLPVPPPGATVVYYVPAQQGQVLPQGMQAVPLTQVQAGQAFSAPGQMPPGVPTGSMPLIGQFAAQNPVAETPQVLSPVQSPRVVEYPSGQQVAGPR